MWTFGLYHWRPIQPAFFFFFFPLIFLATSQLGLSPAGNKPKCPSSSNVRESLTTTTDGPHAGQTPTVILPLIGHQRAGYCREGVTSIIHSLLFPLWSQPSNTLKEGQRTQKRKVSAELEDGGCEGRKIRAVCGCDYKSPESLLSHTFLPGRGPESPQHPMAVYSPAAAKGASVGTCVTPTLHYRCLRIKRGAPHSGSAHASVFIHCWIGFDSPQPHCLNTLHSEFQFTFHHEDPSPTPSSGHLHVFCSPSGLVRWGQDSRVLLAFFYRSESLGELGEKEYVYFFPRYLDWERGKSELYVTECLKYVLLVLEALLFTMLYVHSNVLPSMWCYNPGTRGSGSLSCVPKLQDSSVTRGICESRSAWLEGWPTGGHATPWALTKCVVDGSCKDKPRVCSYASCTASEGMHLKGLRSYILSLPSSPLYLLTFWGRELHTSQNRQMVRIPSRLWSRVKTVTSLLLSRAEGHTPRAQGNFWKI